MLVILFRPTILAAKRANAASLRFRTHGKIYWPGSGLRTKQEIEEEAKCKKEGKWPEEHPFEYTIFGTRRITHDDRFHYSDRKAGKGYTDFSDAHYQQRPYIWPGIRSVTKYYIAIFVFLGIPLIVDYKWFLYHGSEFYNKYFKSDAATIEAEKDEEKNKLDGQNDKSDNYGASNHSNVEVTCSIYDSNILNKKKQKIGFRERRIIHYEDRIRSYSTPDKIFRYFSTIKLMYEDGTFDIYMTPEDFVRSLTPGVMQPRKYGLDKFKVFNANQIRVQFDDKASIFYWLGNTGGLINFGDYLFLMTLLSTSPSEFKLAFHVFDLNGDGELDRQEFERVQELVLSQSNVGQRYRRNLRSKK